MTAITIFTGWNTISPASRRPELPARHFPGKKPSLARNQNPNRTLRSVWNSSWGEFDIRCNVAASPHSTNGTDASHYLFGIDGSGLDHRGEALLILLDLNLPDMGGIEILQHVKENSQLKSTPVVVLTTADDSQEIQRCYELGCNVYVTKPVNYGSFANAIRQLGLFFSVIQVPAAAI